MKSHCITTTLCMTILLLFLSSALNGNMGSAKPPMDVPTHVHLTWQNGNMSTGITVTWQTDSSTSGDIVKYDTVSRNGNQTNYAYSANGTHHTYSGASGWIHDVELSGLSQNTAYFFICGGDMGGYSPERKFRTAPTNSTDLKFVAGGDSRDNPTERDKISLAMRQFNPSFVLYVGDAVATGTDQKLWDDWFDSMDSIWVDGNGYTIPIIPALGNHEGNATNYYEQYALPGNEQWYSLDWGRNVHIIVLDTDVINSSAQQSWLQNDLETHKNVTWKFALFHKPPFSSGTGHGSDMEVRQQWVPEFDKYHVNIIFSGHDHIYERSTPINYTRSNDSPQPSYANASMYVVSGSWGAPLDYVNPGNWWTASEARVYNFVLVDVFSNGTLDLQAKNDAGTTFDTIRAINVTEFSSAVVLIAIATAILIAVTVVCKKRIHAKKE